jgi:thiamine transport system substrate-binding protein
MRRLAIAIALVLVLVVDAGCSGTSDKAGPVTLTLVTHDSFVVSPKVLDGFTTDTGITVKILKSGDGGAVVNQAILTKSHPQGDVLFGVDNGFLSRALDADLFVPYEAKGLDAVDERYILDPQHRATPIDYGDVCLNYDKKFFATSSVPVPTGLDDLTKPAYKGLTVVENPGTSSTGLAFLFGTVAKYGTDWTSYWRALAGNDVAVSDGWNDAYYGKFSGGTGSAGTRPIVVSYASSPPAEVFFSEKPTDTSPIAVVDSTCTRQVEMAGILKGTKHEAAARQLIDFMLSRAFQEDMPLNMFVFPVDPQATLPPVFTKFAATPEHPYEVPAADIAKHRDEWIKTWTDIVLH